MKVILQMVAVHRGTMMELRGMIDFFFILFSSFLFSVVRDKTLSVS